MSNLSLYSFGGHYKLLPFAGEDAGFGILLALSSLGPGQHRRQHYLT